MQEFKLTKPMLSAYYIAAILSFLLFQLIQPVILDITKWVVSFLSGGLNIVVRGNGPLWLCLFLVCLIITVLIRKFVVEPLGFFIKEEAATGWEVWILAFLVLGFYIYLLNQVFEGTPMPSDWWPQWLIRFLGGGENTYIDGLGIKSIEERNIWTVVPWVWHLGPIAFMYMKTVFKKK